MNEIDGGTDDKTDTTVASIAHILGLVSWIVGPLILMVVADDEFTKKNAANALNWQICFTIYFIISVFLTLFLIGFVFVFILSILDLIFCVIGAVKAAEGQAWEYPLTVRIA